MIDPVEFGKQLASLVRDETQKAVAPLLAENESLRASLADLQRQLDARPTPEKVDPVEVDMDAVRALVDASVADAVAALPKPRDGKDVDPDELRMIVATHVLEAMLTVPKPEDGRTPTPEEIRALVIEQVALIPAPKDGTSVTADDVLPQLREQVATAIAAMPVPKDGASVTIADVEPLIQRMADSWALDFERRAQGVLERAVERMPKPKDGKDGADALQLEDFGAALADDGRTLVLTLGAGERQVRRELKLPVVLDRGVFSEAPDARYVKGDGVSFGGSFHIAQVDNPQGKPGASKDWRLACKRGRDGRDLTDRKDAPHQTVRLPR